MPGDESPRNAPGSFRDPQGQVFELKDRIFRALYAPRAPFPQTWSEGGPLSDLAADGRVWPSHPLSREAAPAEMQALAPHASGFLEHPRLAPITYPYEWPFRLLKRAALLHLEIHRAVLKRGINLTDGSAFNVQFVGARPVFIDALAFVPYVEGEPWAGYSQFCESFLNPLLLAASGNTSVVKSYRGNVRGISTRETARQLGIFKAMRAGAFVHVILNSMAGAGQASSSSARRPKLSRAGLDLLLASLERAIRAHGMGRIEPGSWRNYERDNSYSAAGRQKKHAVVQEFAARLRPKLLLDLGCNAGEYSAIALEAGAGSAVGIERDQGAVNAAAERAETLEKPFLPLQMDLQNLSPRLGWGLAERLAFTERVSPDALLSLALLHHLVLSEGVPLDRAVATLVGMAPVGLIEFVPLDDPMAQRIAGPPERMRHPYDLPTFLSVLGQNARIERQTSLGDGGRVVVEYHRPP